MNINLEKKAIIVTGSGRGMGRAMALAFAHAGSDVLINDIPVKEGTATGPAHSVVKEIQALGRNAVAFEGDISKEEDVTAMVQSAVNAFGKLDVIVNNAGNSAPAMLHKMTLEQWNKVIAVHLTGTFLCMREAAKHMIERKQGRIINVISVAGSQGSIGQANYSAAKAGIIGLTKSGAKELSRYNILVNTVSLAVVSTDMTATVRRDPKLHELTLNRILMHKIYEPWEISPVFLFLASDASSSIQGQVIPADGGMTGTG